MQPPPTHTHTHKHTHTHTHPTPTPTPIPTPTHTHTHTHTHTQTHRTPCAGGGGGGGASVHNPRNANTPFVQDRKSQWPKDTSAVGDATECRPLGVLRWSRAHNGPPPSAGGPMIWSRRCGHERTHEGFWRVPGGGRDGWPHAGQCTVTSPGSSRRGRTGRSTRNPKGGLGPTASPVTGLHAHRPGALCARVRTRTANFGGRTSAAFSKLPA